MAACGATVENHCCWVSGEVCEHFRPELVGESKGCALRAELGDWEAVYTDSRYPFDPDRIKCFEWPGSGRTCNACGAVFE